ncbi:MAG TPA: hypothetical protein VMV20_00270, partial [Chitinophagaceae bacterium]|nr:hypothetical protein [Chitinophagaceae bacterium]
MARTAAEETPLMQQHKAIKDQFPDAILLFRVGDFYETFSQDARIASQVLGIVLTRRANGAASFVELAGFPHHALEGYLNKLVKAGHRVAVCDQLEDPRTAKGIVKRGVTEIITPGTTLNDRLLEAKSNNFLAAVHFGTDRAGISFLDLSTGEFIAAEGSWEEAGKLLRSFQPSETLFSRTRQKEFRQRFGSQGYGYALDDWIFSGSYATELLLRQFDTHSLKGFGVADLELAQVAAGAIIHYLKETEHPQLGHVRSIQRLATEDYLWMDQFTIRNLELLAEPGKQDGSLLKVLDHCLSPMGSRMMRRWMLFPLKDPGLIRERLDGVECLVRERDFSLKIAHHLKQVGDLERMAGKIARSKISPRELVQLSRNLAQVEAIGALAEAIPLPSLACRLKDLDGCPALRQRIVSELEEDAPVLASKGGLIRPGVSAELDALRAISREAKECLAAIQQKEAIATGIPSLKVA